MKGRERIEELHKDVEETLEGSADEFSEQLHDLKGILSESLGDFPFKVAIAIIVLFNFLYTFYQAYLATRIDDIIENDCYCDPTDRVFYRTITLTFISSWLCFLFGYGFKYTFGHGHFTCYNIAKKNKRDGATEKAYLELLDMVTTQENNFRALLSDLVSTRFLDDDHIERIKQDCIKHFNNGTKSIPKKEDDTASKATCSRPCTACNTTCICASDVNKSHTETEASEKTINIKWYLFMCTKIILISFRFIFRLFIVPLLLLQWFNEYAWNCLMNNIIRNYCETETSKYYIGLDHSFILYSVYVLLLTTLLFTFVINWFPSGIPEFTLHVQAFDNKLGFNIDKKGQFKGKMLEKRLKDIT